MEHVALITGASGGIGLELAKVHASLGGDLVLVARSTDKLEAVKKILSHEHGVNVQAVAIDLAVPGAAERLFQAVSSANIEIDVLINNAGFGGHGIFYQRDWTRDAAMITLNVLTLTALTRLFIPGMIDRKMGRVLNVASMAGFLPGPLQAVYYATKAYVLSFTEAIANELEGTGISVTALCPGATATGFMEAGDLRGVGMFKTAVGAAEVAEFGYGAMLEEKTVAVPGIANKALVHGLLRAMPRWLITQISRKTMEKGA